MIISRNFWLKTASLFFTCLLLAACGGGSSGGGGSTADTQSNYSILAAVSTDAKTLQAGTADTHEVKTDGTWIVWKGRTINMGYYNGSSVSNLNLGIPLCITPWQFSDHEYAAVAYDGSTIAFAGDDVADADVRKFYYLTPGSDAESIDIPFDFDGYDGDIVFVHGDYAAVIDDSEDALYGANLSDSAPAFTELVFTGDPAGMPVGVYAPVNNSGVLDLINITDGTVTAMTGDGDPGTAISDVESVNDTIVWVEDGNLYYWEEGMADSELVYDDASYAISYPTAGPDYILWMADGQMNYLAKADIGVEDPTAVALTSPSSTTSIVPGDGFIAYEGSDIDGYDQFFIYDLADLTATDGVQATTNGEEAEEDGELIVDGTKVYQAFEYRDAHNPSRVLVMYDHVAGTTTDLTGDRDFQQVATYKAADGRAIFLKRDHSFRLFAKRAGTREAFRTLTPINMMVHTFSVNNRVVTFTALNRLTYLDDDPNLIDTYDGDELSQVYYVALSNPGTVVQVSASDDYSEPENPQTDGDYIAWHSEYYDGSWQYRGWVYDMAAGTATELTDPGGSDFNYKISVDGGIAVWRTSADDINYYDIAADTYGTITDTAGDISRCPHIANGVVTWTDGPSSQSGTTIATAAWYYDFNAALPAAVEITGSNPSYRNNPTSSSISYAPTKTDGSYITWVEYRNAWDHDGDGGATTADIAAHVVVVYDIAADTMADVPAVDFNYTGTTVTQSDRRGPVCFPVISDGVVAFVAYEYGAANSDADKEIFYYDISAAPTAAVQLTEDADGEGLWDVQVDTSGGLIVWRTGGSSRWDWRGKTPAAARIQ